MLYPMFFILFPHFLITDFFSFNLRFVTSFVIVTFTILIKLLLKLIFFPLIFVQLYLIKAKSHSIRMLATVHRTYPTNFWPSATALYISLTTVELLVTHQSAKNPARIRNTTRKGELYFPPAKRVIK